MRWHSRTRPFAVALLLAGCGSIGGIIDDDTPSDPAVAAIARLTGQGFTITSDGRATGEPVALRYDGLPGRVVACAPSGGRAAVTDQSGTATTPDGRYAVTQAGHVAAYVIVTPDGGLRGLYVNDVTRLVASADGTVLARQIETIEFPPGGSARFGNGVTCQPAP